MISNNKREYIENIFSMTLTLAGLDLKTPEDKRKQWLNDLLTLIEESDMSEGVNLPVRDVKQSIQILISALSVMSKLNSIDGDMLNTLTDGQKFKISELRLIAIPSQLLGNINTAVMMLEACDLDEVFKLSEDKS